MVSAKAKIWGVIVDFDICHQMQNGVIVKIVLCDFDLHLKVKHLQFLYLWNGKS